MQRFTRAPIDRFTWGVVAGVLVLAAAGLVSAVVVRSGQSAPDLTTPRGLVTAYITDVQRDDADAAWDLLAPEALERGPKGPGPSPALGKEEFRQQVLNSRSSRSRVRILGVTRSADTATVLLEVTSVSGGLFDNAYSRKIAVSLKRQGESWRITSDPSPWQFR